MAYNTGTLTGTYQHFNGDPAEGVVEIIPNSKSLIDSAGNVILTGRVKVTLDAAGSFAVTLPATDDATVEPALNRQYTVVAKLRHQHLPAVTGIELPGGSTLDMADLTTAEEATASLSVWLTQEEYTALEATVAGKADTASFVAKAFLPSSALSPLPGRLDNRRFNNSMSQAQDSVTTVDGVQYAVWSDNLRHPIVGKRTLPDGAWVTHDLNTGIGGTLIGATTNVDEHNAYSIAVDSNGDIHVAGNMHGDWLRYAKTTTAGDITTLAESVMLGATPGNPATDERAESYPRFFTHPDGTLFYTYRNGSSGNGDQILNRYDAATETWSRVAELLDGTTASESPYLDRVVCDSDGTIHVAYQWMPSAGGSTDLNDLCYIRSTDKGATWTDIDGNALTVPITHAGSSVILDTTGAAGLNNSCGLDVDTAGNPHISNQVLVGGVKQTQHIWHDGSTWQTEAVTAWTTNPSFQPRPSILCPANGRTYLLVNRFYDGWRGSVWLIDATPGETHTHFPIGDFDLRDSELTFDSRALRDDNDLHVMVTPTNATSPALTGEYYADDNWTGQWGAVLSVDLDQLSLLQAGIARRAQVKSVGTVAVAPDQASITATSAAVIPGSFGISTMPEVRNKRAVARMVTKAAVTASSTTLTVQMRMLQQDGGGGLVYLGTHTFTSTGSQTKATPWIPIPNGPVNGYDAQVQGFAYKSGTGNGVIYSATIEIGYLTGPTD